MITNVIVETAIHRRKTIQESIDLNNSKVKWSDEICISYFCFGIFISNTVSALKI